MINATPSLPPNIVPVGITLLGRSSTSSLAYPDAPPPPELFAPPDPPLAPAPPAPPPAPLDAPPLFLCPCPDL